MSGEGHCLLDIAQHVRGCKREARAQAMLVREIEHLRASAAMLIVAKPGRARAAEAVTALADERAARLLGRTRRLLGEGLGQTPVDPDRIVEWLLLDRAPGRLALPADTPADNPDRLTLDVPGGAGLAAMGDRVRHFNARGAGRLEAVCISGAPSPAGEAADPTGELAAVLACGFLLVEAFLARGLAIDDIAPRLSFRFADGLAAEHAVLDRVARRIWAVALRERYGGDGRSQTLIGGHPHPRGSGLDELTDRVEERVLDELVALARAGGPVHSVQGP